MFYSIINLLRGKLKFWLEDFASDAEIEGLAVVTV